MAIKPSRARRRLTIEVRPVDAAFLSLRLVCPVRHEVTPVAVDNDRDGDDDDPDAGENGEIDSIGPE